MTGDNTSAFSIYADERKYRRAFLIAVIACCVLLLACVGLSILYLRQREHLINAGDNVYRMVSHDTDEYNDLVQKFNALLEKNKQLGIENDELLADYNLLVDRSNTAKAEVKEKLTTIKAALENDAARRKELVQLFAQEQRPDPMPETATPPKPPPGLFDGPPPPKPTLNGRETTSRPYIPPDTNIYHPSNFEPWRSAAPEPHIGDKGGVYHYSPTGSRVYQKK